MNLSFPPGDLHLIQSDDGLFILTMAGKKILSTKSEPYALHRFNILRAELEHRLPAKEQSTEEKAELLRKEVSESVFHRQRKQPTEARTTAAVLFEVEAALRSYCDAVLSSDLTEHSQADYIRNAENFVRWLKGDFEPGSRVGAYSTRKKAASSSVFP